jgi:hypothetical protein
MNTESSSVVLTKQWRIAELAEQYREEGMTTLGHYLDMDWMKEAYRRVHKDRRRAWTGRAWPTTAAIWRKTWSG